MKRFLAIFIFVAALCLPFGLSREGIVPAALSAQSSNNSGFTKEEAEKIVAEINQEDNNADQGGLVYYLITSALIPVILISLLFLLGLVGLILLLSYKRTTRAKELPKIVEKPVAKTDDTSSETQKKRSGGCIFFIILFTLLALMVAIGIGGYLIYNKKNRPAVPIKTATSVVSSPISTSETIQNENEFAPVLTPIVGEIKLKYNTEILGGRHIFYVPSRDLTSDDFEKIKSALIAKGYQEFKDSEFTGEKSLTFIKDDNFVRIGKNVKYISITVVRKKDDLKNKLL